MMMLTRKQRGMTLIEVMIAITISAILLSGVVSIYVSTRKSNKLNTGLARVQENLRFVGEMMAQDIRMAGYVGCRGGSMTNALTDITTPYFNIDTPLQGFEGNTSTSSFPTEYQSDATVGSDSLIVLRGDNKDFAIASHNPSSATIHLQNTNGYIKENDIVIVTDCFHSAVFQVTNANPGVNARINHNTGAVSQGPGNCWKKLGPPGNPRPACSASNGLNYTYAGDGKIIKLISTAYYIGPSSSGVTSSLYRRRVDQGVLQPAEELFEGIENMQILYGEDSSGNTLANRYVSADNVSDWNDVVSVRIGFLVATPSDNSKSSTDNKTYTIATTDIGTGTTVSHPADKKLRFSATITVKVRNKGVM
jgi:type IV pilus assembly protein PilW